MQLGYTHLHQEQKGIKGRPTMTTDLKGRELSVTVAMLDTLSIEAMKASRLCAAIGRR
jgi:hypothetical protein